MDLKTGTLAELKIAGLNPPAPSAADNSDLAGSGRPVVVPNQTIQAGKALSLSIPLAIPAGFKLNPRASIIYRAVGNTGQQVVDSGGLGKRRKATPAGETGATASLALTGKPGKAVVEVAVSYQVCRDGKGGLCKLLTTRWKIPVTATADSKTTRLELPAAPKRASKAVPNSGKKKTK